MAAFASPQGLPCPGRCAVHKPCAAEPGPILYRSIDALRRLKPAAMVPAHGVPLSGEDKVEEVMRNFRDAIQFVHDQTVRHMNKGLCPDELAESIALPPHLAGFKPWMEEFFGSVSQSVRAIYQGYLGWFEADPVALAPLPRMNRMRREIELMGGRDHVLAVAQDAFEHGETQWVAELATRIIRIDQDDMAARRLKAAAFRRQGYGQINAIWRNWYLTAARELDGFDLVPFIRDNAGSFVSPDLVGALPARTFVESFATRVKAEDTLGVTMTTGFRFPDIHEEYSLRLRRGVVQIEDGLPDVADLVLTLDKAVLDRILLSELTMRSATPGGQVQVGKGSLIEVVRFFGYFELPVPTPIRLVVR
jgi:alkyl sulfatase BDS1-like metallo-beta-lactamase superfamily hydrolase